MILTVFAEDFLSTSDQPLLATMDAATHTETHWQVGSSPSFEDSTLEEDDFMDPVNLLSLTFDFRINTVSYVRLRFRDSYGMVSEWSVALEVDLVIPVSPTNARRLQFFGRRDANAILLADTGLLDHGEPFDMLIRTDVIAPAGLGGECVFRSLFIKTAHLNEQDVIITPIVDGRRYPEIVVTLIGVAPSAAQDINFDTFEVGLYAVGSPRQGIRGAQLQVEVLLIGPINDEWFEAHGLELEYVQVREAYPVIQPTAQLAQLPTLFIRRIFFAGERSGNRLMQFEAGRDDVGVSIEARVSTNEVAPAGASGACIFPYAYLVCTRANPSDLTLLITPIVDMVEYPAIEVVLEGVTDWVVSVTEIRLHKLYNGRIKTALRGEWIEFRIDTSGPLPDGDVVFDGIEVEFEPVTEARPQLVGSGYAS